MTADLRSLYLHGTGDQAVLRPLTRRRTAAPYERALAADALAARGRAARRAERLDFRPRPYAVAVPAASGLGRTRCRSAQAVKTAVSWSRRPASTR